METNATRMCALLVGLPDVAVLAVDDRVGQSMLEPRQHASRIVHEACSSESLRVDALSKLARASERARKALHAEQVGKDADAFYYLDQLFGGQFPSRLA